MKIEINELEHLRQEVKNCHQIIKDLQKKRQWVGLEIEEVQDSYNSDYQAQTRAVERILKERNT